MIAYLRRGKTIVSYSCGLAPEKQKKDWYLFWKDSYQTKNSFSTSGNNRCLHYSHCESSNPLPLYQSSAANDSICGSRSSPYNNKSKTYGRNRKQITQFTIGHYYKW